MFGPIVPPYGPTSARIAIVGEAPDEEESRQGRPLVGASGQELARMLSIAGLNLADCFKTNVFSRQPTGNNLALYGVERKDASPQSVALGPLTDQPTTYIKDEWLGEIDRLRGELMEVKPNVVVALGNTACWALLGQSGIGGLRGSLFPVRLAGQTMDVPLWPAPGERPLKVLPTYHPAAVLRQWSMRPVVIADFEKARTESLSPDLVYDDAEFWLNPTIEDLMDFGRRYMVDAVGPIATDVETKAGQITCVGFAPTPDRAIVVPFWVDGPEPNYWPTVAKERAAWRWVQRWCEAPVAKVLQNGMYDTQYFLTMGIRPRNFSEDTMLAHHSKYSEMQKGLGFLGSVYANFPNWKKMRTFKREEAEKAAKKDD